MPVALAVAPYALSLYGTLFGARVLRREKVTGPRRRSFPRAGAARGSCSSPICTLAGM